MQPNNFHALTVKHLGPTHTKGARIKITSERFEQSIILNRDHSQSSGLYQAINYLTQNGFDIVGMAEMNNQTILLSNTFKPLK